MGSFGEMVRKKRLSLGENQTQFGKRFGVSHVAISDLERGNTGHISEAMIEFVIGFPLLQTCPKCDGRGVISYE